MSRLGLAAWAALAAGAALAALAGCMIDLAPPSAAVVDAGGGPPSTAGDATPPDPVDAGAPDAGPAACVTAADCDRGAIAPGCLVPTCDEGRCAYALCPTGDACSAAACDLDAGACAAPAPVGFAGAPRTLSTNVPFAALPCGSLGRCVAAARETLFVVDGQSHLSAWLVAEGIGAAYRTADVALDFAPAAVVASGDRVYAVGAPSGPIGALRVRLAWLDAPANPLDPALPVTSVELAYRASSADVPALFAAPEGDLLLVAGREAFRFHPDDGAGEASLARPLPDVPTLGLVASAGDALVGAALDPVGNASFGLVANAGTARAGLGAAVAAPAVGTAAQLAVAGGPTGEVVALSAVGPVVDGGIPAVQKARLTWVVEPGADAVTATASVELGSFAPPIAPPTAAIGPVGVVREGAFVLRAAAGGATTTAALVGRGDGGAPYFVPRRSAPLAGAVGGYGLFTTARGVYVVTASGSTLTVAPFRPACDG